MEWIVLLLIAVAPGTIEVRAIPVETETICRAAAAGASGHVFTNGAVLIDAECEGGA